jgi:hypothetical protein
MMENRISSDKEGPFNKSNQYKFHNMLKLRTACFEYL